MKEPPKIYTMEIPGGPGGIKIVTAVSHLGFKKKQKQNRSPQFPSTKLNMKQNGHKS